jgi:MOSC domain-containing protein YiiM
MTLGRVAQVSKGTGGLPKFPVEQSEAGPLGLAGDLHAHPAFHGGPEKALLLVSSADVEELKGRGWPVFAGALGENLTVEGIDFRHLTAGVMFRIGPVMVELTTLRKPCSQLDVYNVAGTPGRIQDALAGNGYGGWYARVLDAGLIRTGDPVRMVQARA